MNNAEKTDNMIEVAKLLSATYCEAKKVINCLENLTFSELENELVTLRAASGALTSFCQSFQIIIEQKSNKTEIEN